MTDIMKLADDYARCNAAVTAANLTFMVQGFKDERTRDYAEARAALQSAIEALQGEVEGLRKITLQKRIDAKYVAILEAERDALAAKLDELTKQEPVGHFLSNYVEEGLWLCCKAEIKGMTEPLYAAPKALTEDVSYATTVMALIEDYAKSVHDGDDNSCTVLLRTIKASLEQPPKALEPEPLIKFRHGCKWCGKAKCAADCYGITKGTPT